MERQLFFETVRLDRDIMYLKDGKGHAFVDKLISVIDQNKDSFTKICRTNKNGIFMDILRNYLMQIIEQILHQLQKEGCALKISQPVFTYLLADLYISMAKCYLEADHGQDPGSFARDVCLFAVRDFFS